MDKEAAEAVAAEAVAAEAVAAEAEAEAEAAQREKVYKFKTLFSPEHWIITEKQLQEAVGAEEDKTNYWRCMTVFYTSIWYKRAKATLDAAIKDAENPRTVEYLTIKTIQAIAEKTFEGFSIEKLMATDYKDNLKSCRL